MAKIRFNNTFNINRVVKRLVRTILALYVGGTVVTVFGDVMVNTTSSFYNGLSLIGWTVQTNTQTNGTTGCWIGCGNGIATGITDGTAICNAATPIRAAETNCITATNGAGVLAVLGIVALAQIVTEFISW